MAISANTLFHHTKRYETLRNILMSKFYPRIRLENSHFNSTNENWAIEQGVSPILYVHEKSCFVEQARKTLYLSLVGSNTEDGAQTRITEVLPIFSMMKPYEREETIAGKIQRIRYYDEREWRYIPSITNGKFCFLTEKRFNDTNIRYEIDKSNEKFSIVFTSEVINYIIVEREDEILPLIHELPRIMRDLNNKSVSY